MGKSKVALGLLRVAAGRVRLGKRGQGWHFLVSPQLLPLPHSEWVGTGAGVRVQLTRTRTRAQEANLSQTSTQSITLLSYPSTQLHYYPSNSAPRSISISSIETPTEEELRYLSVVEQHEVSDENPLLRGKNRSDNYWKTLWEQSCRFPIMQAENFDTFLKLYNARQVTTPTNAGCDSLLASPRLHWVC